MLVEVAICTWNRASLLEQTLDRLSELRVPDSIDWSVLVVNNACTDETDRVLRAYQDQLPLRTLSEPQPGHSRARNRAVASARGDLLLWTDDDVLVDHEWLARHAAEALEHPKASFFGGPIRPWYAVTPPDWVVSSFDRLDGAILVRDLGEQPFSITRDTPHDLPWGANLSVRTDVLKRYPFDPSLGRVRAGTILGDETTVLRQMLNDGHLGRWIPNAVVQHYIPRERMTLKYVRRWWTGFGRTIVRMNAWRRKESFRQLCFGAIRSELRFRLHQASGDHPSAVPHMIDASYAWGQLAERTKNALLPKQAA